MTKTVLLEDALTEIKDGIGAEWKSYPVYGATTQGIAPAKEQPGKNPHKYKPLVPGTVFYNPMRILIGSIAFVEEGVPAGITSPDYVVLRGVEGVIDSRWFYYWLRSRLGQECIKSLARGAVRERMLFNRLKTAEIVVPDYDIQQVYSQKLLAAQKEVDSIREAITLQLQEVEVLPHRIVEQSVIGSTKASHG